MCIYKSEHGSIYLQSPSLLYYIYFQAGVAQEIERDRPGSGNSGDPAGRFWKIASVQSGFKQRGKIVVSVHLARRISPSDMVCFIIIDPSAIGTTETPR